MIAQSARATAMVRRLLTVGRVLGLLTLASPLIGAPRAGVAIAATPSGTVWTSPTSLPATRYRLAAALGSDGNIYVIGGGDNTIDYNTTFVYHLASNSWTQGTNMPTAREGAQAVTLPDGRIIVLGGGQSCGNQ